MNLKTTKTTDVFSKNKRSEIMSRIRSSDTGIEKDVFRFLRANGIYFQKHYKKATGHPDIALPKKKRVVFIDGDFWYGWHFNQRASKLPKKYWRKKIRNNIERDAKNRRILRMAGWKVMRVWEHQLKGDRALFTMKRIKYFLKS